MGADFADSRPIVGTELGQSKGFHTRPDRAYTTPKKRVAGELLFLSATGHVTLHRVASLERVALVVADFKGIRDG
jgi:hypothetical protein